MSRRVLRKKIPRRGWMSRLFGVLWLFVAAWGGHGPVREHLLGHGIAARPFPAKCGGSLKIVAYVTDELSITRILDHLGLSTPRQDKPPPTREVVQVPVDDEERETEAYREPTWS